MAASIEQRMPPSAPMDCGALCASKLADYILGALQRPQACDPALLPERQLRLLTRWEYINTVRTLLLQGTASDCQTDLECGLERASCTSGQCADDPCGVHTFVFSPGREVRSVAVAGSFNAWSIDPRYEMRPVDDAGDERWYLKAELGAGRHSYKFVIDGAQWEADPQSLLSEPDGFGGQNSVVEIACSEDALDLLELTSGFPEQVRPTEYYFDNNADAGLMTATLLTEQLSAARAIAAKVRMPDCAGLDRSACAGRFFDDFGLRAFRRPLSASERALFERMVLEAPTLQDGLREAAAAILISPGFLYRSELGQLQPDGRYALDGYEIASALSYFLWGTAPDAGLLEAAAQGVLSTEVGIREAATRLLESEKSRSVMERFAAQWLGAERILTVDKRTDLFGNFDPSLRDALLQETQRFFAHAVFEEDFQALFLADYTLGGRELAGFYGLPAEAVLAGQPPRIELGPERSGLLTQGAILGVHAYSDQSSPVHRGLFVRERLLCQPLGAPPPGAGGIPEVDPNATTRERFSQHSSDPSCAVCHRLIDDIGFGFEQFDAIGQHRDTEAGRAIDHRGLIRDLEAPGTEEAFETPRELGEILARSPQAERCFSTQLYRFARGVLESFEDECSLVQVQQQLAASGDIRELLLEITQTPAFRYRR